MWVYGWVQDGTGRVPGWVPEWVHDGVMMQ